MGNNDLSTGFHLNIPRETYNPLSQDLSYTKFKVSFITSVSNKSIKTKMEFFKEALKSEKIKYYSLMEKIPELYESVYHERMLE